MGNLRGDFAYLVEYISHRQSVLDAFTTVFQSQYLVYLAFITFKLLAGHWEKHQACKCNALSAVSKGFL